MQQRAGQWAVQTALGGYQSIKDLVAPGGRLYESRRAIVDGVTASKYLELPGTPGGRDLRVPAHQGE